MSDVEYIEHVLHVIREHAPAGAKRAMITAETPLTGQHSPFDSIQLLDLMLVLESELGVRIREEDVTPDTFKNVTSLARTIAAIKDRG